MYLHLRGIELFIIIASVIVVCFYEWDSRARNILLPHLHMKLVLTKQ